MSSPAFPEGQVPAAHRHFAATCFNRTWDLMEKAHRTAEDDLQMECICLASLWHWSQREDCTLQNQAIGHWQASRVYVLLHQAENAMRHAEIALRLSQELSPFYLGYAHEAQSRAALLRGDRVGMAWHRSEARECLAQVVDPDEHKLLEKDLETLQ